MKLRALVATLAVAGNVPLAAAQTSESPSAVEAQSSGEIIVTAQKRSERLIDVPLSISTLSAEQLTDAGIDSTLDLQQVSPGIMTVTNGIGFVPSIRGVQSTGTSPGDEGNVAIYLDDVSLGSPLAGYFDLADIERIEVLKGPQGTLFGRNATGGAIRIMTRRPSFTPGGSLSADYGLRYEETRLGGYITGPLTDWAAASLSGSYREGDGFISGIDGNEGRTYGGTDNYLMRGKLLLNFGSDLDVLLAADASSTRNDVAFTSGREGGGNAYPGIPGAITNGPYTFAGSTQPYIEVEGRGVSADVTWEPGDLTFRSITSYREVELDSQADGDRTNQPLFAVQIAQYQDSFSQEFNLSGPEDDFVSWLVGAYYYKSEAGNPYFRIIYGDAPGDTTGSEYTNRVDSEATSVFGEVTFNPTSRLHLTAGLRYNTESKDFHYEDVVAVSPQTTDASESWDSTVYRLVGRYEFSDDANIYASFSTGFKSGVYNAYSPLDVPVDPETIEAFEIGLKARLGAFMYTLAAFSYSYDDLQLSTYTTVNGAQQVVLSNAASAQMSGVEFTADGEIAEGWSLGFGISWQPEAEYDDFTGAQVLVPIPGATDGTVANVVVPYDASGSRMVRSPEVTANLRLTYERSLWNGHFNGTVNAYHNSGFYWQPGEFTEEDSYNVVNMHLSWTDGGPGITYSLWGNNLTNEAYAVDLSTQELGNSVSLPPLAEFGVGISYAF